MHSNFHGWFGNCRSKNHRWHHLHSDTPADRHTPRDGLWHAHLGWLVRALAAVFFLHDTAPV